MHKLILAMVFALSGTGTPAWAAQPEGRGIQFVVNNNVWQPGGDYKSGADWLALTCTPSACRLEPAALTVKPESWRGPADLQATQGQKLKFSKPGSASGQVMAWLLADAGKPWLAPGTVTTYASAAAPLKRPDSAGTLEVAVDLPNGRQAAFVPLVDESARIFILQLRAEGRRQSLGQLASCSHVVSTRYFLWAGDMDQDGKPDYLVSYVDDAGAVILYLSSLAAADELVGVGGLYTVPPQGGKCDDGGWFGGG